MSNSFNIIPSIGEAPAKRDIPLIGSTNTDEQSTTGDVAVEEDTDDASSDTTYGYEFEHVDDEDDDADLREFESFQSDELLEMLKLGWNPRANVEVGQTGLSEEEFVATVNNELWALLEDADSALDHEDLAGDAVDTFADTEGVRRLVGKVVTAIQTRTAQSVKERLNERANRIIELVAAYEAHRDIIGDPNNGDSTHAIQQEDLSDLIEEAESRDTEYDGAAGLSEDADEFNVADVAGLEDAEKKLVDEEQRRRHETANIPGNGSRSENSEADDVDDNSDETLGDSDGTHDNTAEEAEAAASSNSS